MTRGSQSGNTTQRVDEVLKSSDSGPGSLIERARYLLQLESLLTACLEPDLASHFQVAATRKNRLILVSPGASWATRLRMQAPHLITALHKAGASQIEHIDIRVAPIARRSTVSRSKKPLSAAAKQALGHMAHLIETKD
jgi:hypothetical protein